MNWTDIFSLCGALIIMAILFGLFFKDVVKKIAILTAILFVLAHVHFAYGSAATVYVSQSGGTFSGGSACNGQSTISLATANSSSSWGSGASQIGPGTTVYLCGALTASGGAVGLNVQNSGTSSSPIIILFDSGATLEAPYFAGNGNLDEYNCGSACAAIEVISENYIIIDGGTNGLIENTANGSSLANQQTSVGVYANGVGITIRNLSVEEIYQDCGASSSCTDTNGQFTTDVRVGGGASQVKICNNTLNDARAGISLDVSDSASPTITLTCASNSFQAGINVFANTTTDHVWQLQGSGSGSINIWINKFGDFTNWYYPGSSYHTDGIIYRGDTSEIPTAYVYDNLFQGDLGTVEGTSYIYCTSDGLNDGSGSICYSYRNIINGTGSMVSGSATSAPLFGPGRGSGGGPVGPYYYYFNTFIGGINTFENADATASVPYTFIGNIFDPRNSSDWFYVQEESNPAFSLLTVQGNAYNQNGRSSGPWQWGTGGIDYTTLSAWQSACSGGGGGGGCDSTATSGSTFAYNSAFQPTSGSYTGIAPNETSLASTLVGINMAPPTSWGVGATCCGAVLSSSAAWDAGAVPSGGSSGPTSMINWTDVHQIIDGYGVYASGSDGTLTSSQAQLLFSQSNGIGLSLVRVQVSDGNNEPGNCSSVGSACLGDSGTVTNVQYAVSYGAKPWSTPWSAPASMKSNSSTICNTGSGNSTLNTSSYSAWAQWLSNWIASWQSVEGITMYAISEQNEPDYCPTTYDGMTWTEATLDTFIDSYLGPTLTAAGQSGTLLMMPETSSCNGNGTNEIANYGTTAFEDSTALDYLSIAACHDYSYNSSTGGQNIWLGQETFPVAQNAGKHYWETEVFGQVSGNSGTFDGSITDALTWAEQIHNWMVTAGANAWGWWNAQSSGDNEGLIDSINGIPKRTYAIGNFAKFVRPGYYRIDTGTNNPQSGVYVSAYQNTIGGNFAAVAINTNTSAVSQQFTITNAPTFSSMTVWVTSSTLSLSNVGSTTVSGNVFSYSLPPQSITSFVGQSGSSQLAATPVIMPGSGSYSSSQTVSISCSSPTPTIYYTTNGTTPTISSPVYAGSFLQTIPATVQAICTSPGYLTSNVAGVTYTQTPIAVPSAPATPSFTFLWRERIREFLEAL